MDYIYFFNFIMSTIGVNIILYNIQWIPKLLMAWKNMIHVYVISIYLFFCLQIVTGWYWYQDLSEIFELEDLLEDKSKVIGTEKKKKIEKSIRITNCKQIVESC